MSGIGSQAISGEIVSPWRGTPKLTMRFPFVPATAFRRLCCSRNGRTQDRIPARPKLRRIDYLGGRDKQICIRVRVRVRVTKKRQSHSFQKQPVIGT